MSRPREPTTIGSADGTAGNPSDSRAVALPWPRLRLQPPPWFHLELQLPISLQISAVATRLPVTSGPGLGLGCQSSLTHPGPNTTAG